jgi:hypothetical protein
VSYIDRKLVIKTNIFGQIQLYISIKASTEVFTLLFLHDFNRAEKYVLYMHDCNLNRYNVVTDTGRIIVSKKCTGHRLLHTTARVCTSVGQGPPDDSGGPGDHITSYTIQ